MSDSSLPHQAISAQTRVASAASLPSVRGASLSSNLEVGTRLEIQLLRQIDTQQIEVRARPLGSQGAWSAPTSVRFAPGPGGGQPAEALAAVSPHPAGSRPTLTADVVEVSNARIALRLLPATPRSPAAPLAAGTDARQSWLANQLRQHLPQARPLAATLERWLVTSADTPSAKPVTVSTTSAVSAVSPTSSASPTSPVSATPYASPTSPTSLASAALTPATDGQALAVIAAGATADDALRNLIGKLASSHELTNPTQLAQRVQQSGIWLESLLAQSQQQPSRTLDIEQDLKAQLLRLAEHIRATNQAEPSPTPPTAAKRPEPPTEPAQHARGDAPLPTSVWAREAAPTLTRELFGLFQRLLRRGSPPPTAGGAARPAPAAPAAALSRQPEAVQQRESGSTAAARPTSDGEPAATKREAVPATPEQRPTQPPAEQGHQGPSSTASAAHDRPGLTQLAKDVDGMLKQLVSQQLQSLDQTTEGSARWTLELPFKTPGGVHALEADIRREPPSTGKERDAGWTMRLRLDLPRLGAISIHLSLRAERLSAGLRAADRDSAALLEQGLAQLRQRIEGQDIQVTSLSAGQQPAPPNAPQSTKPLLEERA